jgi:polyhydroxybutyrate depolymerase
MRISGPRGVRRMVTAAAVCLVLAVVTAGCRAHQGDAAGSPGGAGAVTGMPVGSSDHSIPVDGVSRDYIVYRPAVLQASAALVVMLHGGFGSASQAEKSYRWDAAADAGHFLVAYPNGIGRAWNTGGGCCGTPGRTAVDDVGFITAMVTAIEREIPVDAGRVYATGISNGGIMAYTLACRTGIFAAIGPDSATQLGNCPHPALVSVIAIHGTADQRIPYAGGRGAGIAHIDGPAVPAVNAAWRHTDNCASPVMSTAGPVTTSVANCQAGRSVELITIAGAGHQWPGSVPSPVAQRLLRLDAPSQALNATQVIWRFFAAHHRLRRGSLSEPPAAFGSGMTRMPSGANAGAHQGAIRADPDRPRQPAAAPLSHERNRTRHQARRYPRGPAGARGAQSCPYQPSVNGDRSPWPGSSSSPSPSS